MEVLLHFQYRMEGEPILLFFYMKTKGARVFVFKYILNITLAAINFFPVSLDSSSDVTYFRMFSSY